MATALIALYAFSMTITRSFLVDKAAVCTSTSSHNLEKHVGLEY